MNSPTKELLIAEIEKNKKELISLCSDLIKIDSSNPPGDMGEITSFITNFLSKHKISWEILDKTGSTPNIIAKTGPDSGCTLILNGHMDVVPAGDISKWDVPPFSGLVKDGVLHGRGATDMKCGIGGLLFALSMIVKHQVQLKGKALLTIVPDEEIGGPNGTKWLVENGITKGDACIVAEPSCHHNCEIGQKGSLWLKLIAQGKSAHGSLAPFAGDNAIEKLLKAIEAIRSVQDLQVFLPAKIEETMKLTKKVVREELLKQKGAEYILDHLTFNVGKICGGTKVNMVPDHAEAEIDIRIPVGLKADTVREKIEFLLKKSGIEGIQCVYNGYSDPNTTDQDEEIVETLAANVRAVADINLQKTFQWASSDTKFYRYAGIPTIQYGPANLEGIHSYNESVNIDEVVLCTKVYLGTIMDYLGYDT
ncbi:MAG: M20 family metallopeptidase [Clostridiales bacterium]|nr:M20 family metallopeptidase [Clostridiales bacterium]